MDEIIGLVREYRNTSDASDKTKLAQSVVLGIADRLTLFLISRCPGDLADVRQSIFVAIVLGLDGFRGESDGEFWAWCYQIARNVLNKYFKKEKAELTISLDPTELTSLIEASGR